MSWADGAARLLSIAKTISDLELRFKQQNEEIMLLRKEVSAIHKEMAAMGERLARLEEGRNTVAADVKRALSETLMEIQMEALRKENEELKRRQIPPSDGNL